MEIRRYEHAQYHAVEMVGVRSFTGGVVIFVIWMIQVYIRDVRCLTEGEEVLHECFTYGEDCMHRFQEECHSYRELDQEGTVQQSCAWRHIVFVSGAPTGRRSHGVCSAIRNLYTTKKLCERTKTAPDRLRENPYIMSLWYKMNPQQYSSPVQCGEGDLQWRRIDGACNNLRHPTWGMASRTQRRLLPPVFDDGIDSVRSSGGEPLPNPRRVSNALHSTILGKANQEDQVRTVLTMHFGQLLDHDITLTPALTGEGGAALDCCNADKERMECMPIEVPEDDPHFTTQRCLNFARSEPALLPYPGPRENVNGITSYVDCSFVYGSSQEEQQHLRQHDAGLLRVSDNDLLPRGADSACIDDPGQCVLAGDERVNVAMGLTTLHTLMVRQHNVMATKLRQINPRWDDERLFQTTRKILTAIFQHVTYNEYLYVTLGSNVMQNFGLWSTGLYRYSETTDATICNAFSTAAFRFGHTQIPSITKYVRANLEEEVFRVEDILLRPTLVTRDKGHNIHNIVRWLTRTKAAAPDRQFEDSIRNRLFQDDKGTSLDLVSLNIQRGRDHGLPPYNRWREFCGLGRAPTFTDLKDHDPETGVLLSQIYKNVDDIDLYVGGISERHLPGAAVGPTFACIIAGQFHKLKYGDRFWYENGQFTEAQLNSIKGMTLSKIMCETSGLFTIQRWALRPIDCSYNPVMTCGQLPGLDLSLFMDQSAQVECLAPRRWDVVY